MPLSNAHGVSFKIFDAVHYHVLEPIHSIKTPLVMGSKGKKENQ
jgi:hypothetical protein